MITIDEIPNATSIRINYEIALQLGYRLFYDKKSQNLLVMVFGETEATEKQKQEFLAICNEWKLSYEHVFIPDFIESPGPAHELSIKAVECLERLRENAETTSKSLMDAIRIIYGESDVFFPFFLFNPTHEQIARMTLAVLILDKAQRNNE